MQPPNTDDEDELTSGENDPDEALDYGGDASDQILIQSSSQEYY